MRVRAIDPGSEAEIALVAERMRATLVEVLGEARGGSMYSMDWLVDRVRFHLDPSRSTGAVLLAETAAGSVAGHTIVRVEAEAPADDAQDGGGRRVGLFSTTYVAPAARRAGVATRLVQAGEAWMREQGLAWAVTFTADDNAKLVGLYARQGYAIVASMAEEAMVKLEKRLLPRPLPQDAG